MTKFLPHIGLDIGSKSIKLVQLNQGSVGKFSVTALGQVPTPGDSNPGTNQIVKSDAIKKLLKDTNPSTKQAVICLPESQVYTRVIEMPILAEPELSQAIKWQAEQYIPVPLSDVVLKHQIITQPDTASSGGNEKMTVLLIAAPNEVLNNQISLVEKAGLEVVSVETEILAVARALIGTDINSPSSLLVHFGAESTTLSLLSRGNLIFTQPITAGGAAIIRSVASGLSLEYAQAEEYTKIYGLDGTKLEGKVSGAVKPVMNLILAETKKAFAFYETHSSQDTVKRVVLSGGASLIPGLVQYFTEELGLEVQLGNPFLNITITEKQKAEIDNIAPQYVTAVGLALKLL